MKIKLFISGIGTDQDIDDVLGNIGQYLDDYEELKYKDSKQDKEFFKDYKLSKNDIAFKTIYEGEFEPNSDDDSPIKLTHHAEGLYEDTTASDIHVEVWYQDKWYGGDEHEKL